LPTVNGHLAFHCFLSSYHFFFGSRALIILQSPRLVLRTWQATAAFRTRICFRTTDDVSQGLAVLSLCPSSWKTIDCLSRNWTSGSFSLPPISCLLRLPLLKSPYEQWALSSPRQLFRFCCHDRAAQFPLAPCEGDNFRCQKIPKARYAQNADIESCQRFISFSRSASLFSGDQLTYFEACWGRPFPSGLACMHPFSRLSQPSSLTSAPPPPPPPPPPP